MTWPTSLPLRGALCATLLWTPACSHEAWIHLKDSSTVDGEIVGGTSTSLLVQPHANDGPPLEVARDDVRKIVHPGTLTTILSSLFFVGGLAVMSYGIATESGCTGDFCGYGHLFLTVPGAGVAGLSAIPMTWGIYAWSDSAIAAGAEDGPSPGEAAAQRPAGVAVHF